MVVPGEVDGDVVLEEDWLEQLTQAEFRAVPPARRVDRMVEVRNLPLRI